MVGILKKSASLAIIPKGTPKELFKIWPEKSKKLDNRVGAKPSKKSSLDIDDIE